MLAKFIMFVIILLASCSPANRLHFVSDSTTIRIDTIHYKYYSDSISRDTIRFTKQYVHYDKTPRTPKGNWVAYTVLAAILIGLFIVKN